MAYVAGALLVFFVAFGMGTTAAILVGWQRGPATSDSGGPTESSTLEDTVLETTSNAKNANPDEVSFVHRATDETSSGGYTYLSEPTIDGDANAIVLVEPTLDRGSRGGTTYDHNIGVWYAPVAQKWAIFNQDRAAVPAEATFLSR